MSSIMRETSGIHEQATQQDRGLSCNGMVGCLNDAGRATSLLAPSAGWLAPSSIDIVAGRFLVARDPN
jgi:hypothetical protein